MEYSLAIKQEPTSLRVIIRSKNTKLFSKDVIALIFFTFLIYLRLVFFSEKQLSNLRQVQYQQIIQQNYSYLLRMESNFLWYSLLFITFHSIVLFLKGNIVVIEESMLIMKNTGIQLQQKNLFGRKREQFYDIYKYREILIHEVSILD